MIELRIDPEFRDVIRPLSEEEFKQLEENILSDGEIYEPICVWNGTIVDGHNRNMIWNSHKELPEPRIREISFNNKDEAIDWICKKQLGRRNLTEEEKRYTMGKMYEARKKSVGEHKGNQYTRKMECTQNGNIPKPHGRIGEIMAKELGVGHGTVLRAADYAKGIDRAEEVVPGIKEEILSGKLNASQKDISAISKIENDHDVKAAIEEIRKPKPRKVITDEDRKRMEFIHQINEAQQDRNREVEYTIDDLVNEIMVNGMNYVSSLKATLTKRQELFVGYAIDKTTKAE